MIKILNTGVSDQTISKSRFVAVAQYCDYENDAISFLRNQAKEHKTATHLAYAYRILTEDGIAQRFSDAGEPSGTAGKPILQLIEGRDLINLCVCVIRYYGGINLGTGGLSRAYGGTAKAAIENAQTGPYVKMAEIAFEVDYKMFDGFIRDVLLLKGTILNKSFNNRITVTVLLPEIELPNLISKYN